MRSLATTVVKNAAWGPPQQPLAKNLIAARFFTVAAPRWRRCRDRRIQRGYTLLELILALSLSVVVLTLIFSAISLYVFQVTKQQARVERELVSRSVLKIVANDIRAALESRPSKRSLSGRIRLNIGKFTYSSNSLLSPATNEPHHR